MRKNRYDLWNCIKNYRFHSIFFKNLVLILMVILLPLSCLLAISYYAYGQIQTSEERAYLEKQCNQISADLERLFSELCNKAILLNSDSDTSLFFLAQSIEEDEFYDVGNILDFVSLCKISTGVVDDVYVYAPYSRVVISTAGRYTYENFSDQQCIDAWEDNGTRYQIEYLNRKIAKQKKENLCFYYTTKQLTGHDGVVIFHINMNQLDKLLDYGEDISLAMRKNGQVIYESHRKTEEAENGQLTTYKEVPLNSNALKQCEVEAIAYINHETLNDKLVNVRNVMLASIGIMSAVSIVLVFYISLKIFDPIKEIMNAFESENTVYEEKLLQGKNEMNYIMSSVYAQKSKNRDIEQELVERITLLKKAQAVALQAQINPHFLNNTLETINWMTVGHLGVENDVSEMVNCLSQLLRISLDTSNTFVSLKREVEYVQKYLYIQQKRLGDCFEVQFSIPKELEECKIIKMVLQPLIENAIQYGIKPFGNQGVLRVEAVKADNKIRISVKDSGLGITEEEVDEINKTIQKTVIKESNHIGLSNVNQRIILAFGEEYGVTLKSKIPMGTEVMIEIPYLK